MSTDSADRCAQTIREAADKFSHGLRGRAFIIEDFCRRVLGLDPMTVLDGPLVVLHPGHHVVGANEYGTPVSVHTCATCGQEFTVCPPSTVYGPDCLADECHSYDPSRDASIYFLPDDPSLIEGRSS